MISENTFTGEFLYSLDDKGRVNIPSKFRSSLSPDNDSTFIITKGMDPCVVAYPATEWRKVEEGLRQLSSASQVYRSFIRSTVRYATPAKMDKQGRIQISPALRDFAGLVRDVIIIGVVNKIEIWNPDKLKELEASMPPTVQEELDNLAEKIIL
ncbi:MAG: division/cell wall cluster transcriptional repressor MraZ [Fidelibacterota bacterium]